MFDQAMQHLWQACSRDDQPAPSIYAALVNEHRMSLRLLEADMPPPATPWMTSHDGRLWYASRSALEALPTEPRPPGGQQDGHREGHAGFVTIGSFERSRVLVDLSRAPGAVSVGGDPALASALAAFVVGEITSNPWSRGVHVTVVTPEQADTPHPSDQVSRVDTAADLIATLETGVAGAPGWATPTPEDDPERDGAREFGPASEFDPAASFDPVLQDGPSTPTTAFNGPLEVIVCRNGADQDVDRLAALAGSIRRVCLIVAGPDAGTMADATAWRFLARADGTLDTGILGFTVDMSLTTHGLREDRRELVGPPLRDHGTHDDARVLQPASPPGRP